MVKVSLLALAALGVVATCPGSASATTFHHGHHHYRHHAARHHGPYTIGYGDTIISGRTGFHHDILTNASVPDSEAPDFILSGRQRGSGLGANGLPGSNLDD